MTETIGRHRGFHDPGDPEVEMLTPKLYSRRYGVDLHDYDHVWMPVGDGSERKFKLELDFAELTYGTRTYFRCPKCSARRQKLLRPPEHLVYLCRQCWEKEDVMRYACNLRHGEEVWEMFEKDLHQARKYEKKLAYKPRPRGARRRRLRARVIVHRLDAEQGRQDFLEKQYLKMRELDAVFDAPDACGEKNVSGETQARA